MKKTVYLGVLWLLLSIHTNTQSQTAIRGRKVLKQFLETTEIRTSSREVELELSLPSGGKVLDGGVDVPNRPVNTSTEVGSTSGKLSVSLTGAATYAIPVIIPPGIKDVVPKIGISYSSQASNGLAGWGWNVSGLSTISRIPAIKYYDKKNNGVDFKDDRFAIDGQRLLLKSGKYGADKAVYQTENYSNVKIISYGTSPYGSNYGPSYFIVYYPNGARAWYGNAGGSRSRLEWAIYKWQDSQGNFIEYNYQQDNGLLSINTIGYGTKSGTASLNKIHFTYQTRKRPEIVFVGGHKFERTNLLNSIQVKVGNSQYRKYVIKHATTSLGYQNVSSVTEYNAKNKSMTPIYFDYERSTPGFQKRKEVSIAPGFDYKTGHLITGEFTGDGRTDVVVYKKNDKKNIYLYYNLYNDRSYGYRIKTDNFSDIFASKILSKEGKLLAKQGITLVDDISTSKETKASIRFRTFTKETRGSVVQYEKIWKTAKYQTDLCGIKVYKNIPKKYVTGDFNGDGLTDVLAIQLPYTLKSNCRRKYQDFPGHRRHAARRSSGRTLHREIDDREFIHGCQCNETKVNRHNSRVDFIDLKRTKTTNFTNLSGHLNPAVGPKDKVLVADHDGDGRQDVYHFKEGKLYIYTINDNNKLIKIHQESDTTIKLDNPILLGDYNGDGKTDFMTAVAEKFSRWKMFISKGKSFHKETTVLPFAFNKDKLGSKTKVVSGVSIKKPYYEYRYVPQDVNGDGKTDVILHRVVAPYSSYDKSVEYVTVYKNHNTNTRNVVGNIREISIGRGIPIHGGIPKTVGSIGFSFETHFVKRNGGVNKFGRPIFLEQNRTNGNLEYAYISVNHIYAYEFTKDSRNDTSLRSVTNNGVKTTIQYERMGGGQSSSRSAYSNDASQSYPYTNINYAYSYRLVKKLTEEASGLQRTQDFKYHGAVSHVDLGYQGFLRTSRTNWYGDGVGTLWTVSKHDPTKKNVIVEQWTGTSSGASSLYITKTTNTYKTNLASNKMFSNMLIKSVHHDRHTRATTTKTYEYDRYNNLLEELQVYQGGSSKTKLTYSNNPNANDQHYYVGRITKKINTSIIGGNSFIEEEQYVYKNNLLTQNKVKGTGTSWKIETFAHDTYGNITKKTLSSSGVSPRTEKFEYDTSGRFIKTSIDVEGLKTTFTYDVFGNPLTTTNPFGQKTTFTHDGWNRLKSEKNFLGKMTSYKYTRLTGGGVKKYTDYPQGADIFKDYNALGWIVKSGILGLKNKWTYKSFKFDAGGRKIAESEPYFSKASQWNTTAYDNFGRIIAKTSFNGLVANIQYNGLTTTVNEGTKTVKTTKDAGGNIIKLVDNGGTINYTYHGNGVMKSANYGGHIVHTEIDGWGRKKKLTDPSAGTYTYKHNNFGELLTETAPKGTTSYTYDAFGKMLTKSVKGDNTDIQLQYAYNTTTKLITSIKGKNNRTNENYSYTYQYDLYKRPRITKEQNGKAYFEHSISRDRYGRVIAETYVSKNKANVSSKVSVKKIYDTHSGVLSEIRDAQTNTSLWTINEVNDRGQSKKVTLGNGMVKNKTYNSQGFLTKILDQISGKSPKTALHVDYSFDVKRGNLLKRKNHHFSWNEEFSYDALDRLTNIAGSINRNQTYDTRGRISNNSTLGAYKYATKTSYRLQEIDVNTEGSLYYQNAPMQSVTYNAFKKTVNIVAEDKGKVNFEYSILQNRSHSYYGGKNDDKLKRRYQKHYSAISPVEIEEDAKGNTKIITYIGGDAYSAPVVYIQQTAKGTSSGYHYLHRDYLNSILAISDSKGKILEQRQFGAWGEVDRFKRNQSEINFKYDTSLLNRGYTGHEHFVDVALIHMNGRMYDAKLGRFLSPDNYIQEPFSTQSFNRYGYVWNNPLKYTDQSGEFFWVAVAYAAAVGATIGAVSYVINAAITGNWNWGDFGKAILGGAISGAITGAIAPGAVLMNAVNVGFGASVAMGVVAGFLPGFDIQVGDFNFRLSPAIAFGKAYGVGANVSVSYTDGNFSMSAGFGATYFGAAHGTGHKGWEYRTSYAIGYSDGDFTMSVYTTYFNSGETSQQIGGLSLGHGEWNIRYENDFIENPLKGIGKYLSDDHDRFRTAALQLSYKNYSINVKFFTGEPDRNNVIQNGIAKHGVYNNPEADKYRLGSISLGYKGYQIAHHNEKIRHLGQNKIVHDNVGAPWFRRLPGSFPAQTYFQYQSYNPYTLW